MLSVCRHCGPVVEHDRPVDEYGLREMTDPATPMAGRWIPLAVWPLVPPQEVCSPSFQTITSFNNRMLMGIGLATFRC